MSNMLLPLICLDLINILYNLFDCILCFTQTRKWKRCEKLISINYNKEDIKRKIAQLIGVAGGGLIEKMLGLSRQG